MFLFKKKEKPVAVVIVPDLPIGIISDILSRLPSEDVARYRCVCKGWDNLSKEPYFTHYHCTTSSQQQRHTILLCKDNEQKLYQTLYLINNREENINTKWRTIRISTINHRIKPVVVASFNGLLCIKSDPSFSEGPNLIFNPLTKNRISLPQVNFHPLYGRKCGYSCVLGFDSINKKYKVVKCYRDGDFGWVNRLTGVIITLGESSWRMLHFPDEFERLIYTDQPLFFNGAFHWVFGKQHHFEDSGKYETHLEGILELEISSEKFEITKFSHPLVLPAKFSSPVQLENSVAFYCHKKSDQAECHSFDIWQILGTNTDGSCLYNHKTFTLVGPRFKYIRAFALLGALANGFFLFEASLWNDPGCKKLVLYDPDKDEGSVIVKAENPRYFNASVFTPSLISPAL